MKHYAMLLLLLTLAVTGCKNTQKATETADIPAVGPAFCADSAYVYCMKQCDFGPRVMNSKAHDDCRDWIVEKFKSYGCTVTLQQAAIKGYDGTMLQASNIIASIYPERTQRVMLCAHYDSRPWADNDPDEANHHTPVIAANDGASGVAVMLEVARLLQEADSAKVGVDFICFDAEDYGTPQWYDGDVVIDDPWALGSQHWAQSVADAGYKYKPRYGVLLDMVGGENAVFYREGMSLRHCKSLVEAICHAASVAGYGHRFPRQDGGFITDDHVPVNEIAHIPCADIIPYFPQCETSSFGPTWHTVSDTMEHISRETLSAVGQTLIQLIYSEQ